MNRKIIKKLSVITLIFSFVMGGLNLQLIPASAALNAAGPISTVHGFPVWYQDQSGLALQPCLGLNADGTGLADPNCVLPLAGEELNFNPGVSTSFPNNFPSEFFYYIGDAGPFDIGSVGAKAKFRMALEGAFASLDGSPAVNQQIAFLRINFAVNQVGGTNGLTPSSTYTINHPYGSFTVTTDALGDIIAAGGADFRAEDGAFTPPLTTATSVSFLTAVNTNIGPFLRAVSPAAPAGYIGNPNITQTIQAGPGGAVFSMSGPAVSPLGGNIVSTDQWALAGKIAVIDTIAPVIGATSPASVAFDGVANVNFGANVIITDDRGVFNTTIDLGPLGNNFAATINGANAGTASAGTGSGTFTIDTTANTLTFNISIAGLTGTETSAHIHGPLQALFTLPLGASKIGTWNYPEAAEADILAGNMSVQIHTNAVPAGEISGPILPQANIQAMSRTLGTPTNGTWFVNVPSATRLGAFNLPIVASDGSNTTNGTMILAVVSPLASVSVAPATASVIVGSTQQLTALPIDNGGAPFVGGATVWSSSNNAIATVSATGLVTGVAAGTTTITASVTGAGATVTNTSTITVTPVPVLTSIAITPAAATILLTSPTLTQQFTASALDQFGAPMAPQPAITWTSGNLPVATIDAAGLATGLTVGSSVITAASGAISGTATLAVTTAPQVFTSMSLTPAATSLTGGTQQLTATALDQFGNAMAPQPAFTYTSSNPAVATVNASGLVTVVSAGTAIITAASGAINAASAITVTDVLTTINVTPATITIGGTQPAAATALNQFGAPMTAVFTWSSNNAPVAAINSASGLISAITAGTATITATSGLVSGTATVNVVLGPTLTTINVTPTAPAVLTGGTKQLTAATLDQNSAPIATTLTWSSSNAAVATVDANGLITGVSAGTATITATSGTVSGSVLATVQVPVLSAINVTPANPSVTAGNTLQLSAAGADQLGGIMSLTGTTTWSSSNASVGTVSQTGLFAALSAGSATVSAANSTATGTVSITVNAPAPALSTGGGGGGAVISGGGGGGGGILPPPTYQSTAPGATVNSEVENQINRQLEIEREFRLRQGGQVLGERIEFRQIQLNQILSEAELVNGKNLIALLANAGMARLTNKEGEVRAKFTAKLKANLRTLSQDGESAITNFIAYGTANTKKLGEGERAGVLDSYKAAYGKLPTTKSEWQDALKIAIGRFPGQASAAAEARAKVEFKKIYLRDASMSNEKDKAAVNVMAYGLRPDNRNTNSEKAAISIFRAIFKNGPSSAIDWDKVRAISYSGAKR